MCLDLKLKYSHLCSWIRYTVSTNPQKHEMRNIAWVSGRNTLYTDQKSTIDQSNNLITDQKLLWSLVTQMTEEMEMITDRGIFWADDKIFWDESSSVPKPQFWSHRGYPETEPSLLWSRETILTPRARISMDVKSSNCRMLDCLIVRRCYKIPIPYITVTVTDDFHLVLYW